MYRRIFALASIIFISLRFYGFAQEGMGTTDEPFLSPQATEHMLVLARSSLTYRVTPGDVYTLVFSIGTTSITYVTIVDTAYRVRVANMGVVNGAGRTFAQVRTEVENLVARNHPLSGPQLILTQPAVFRVFVNGEVHTAGERSAWGLSKLSSLIDGNLTRLASIRNISITSINGQTRSYDLFRFQRLGDQTQNPYLRPGDVITFNKISRLVTIQGEVERPGTYQLLDGENIRELIEFYGNGFTPLADSTRIEMVRRVNSEDVSGDRIFLTMDDLAHNFALENFDIVSVPPTTQLMPVMFVEGAVNINVDDAELVTTNRVIARFNVGETYAAMVRRNAHWFSAVSDTQNAYIVRRTGEHIPINLDRALFDASYRGEILIEESDTLIVPFRQFFVTVAGAVMNPGRFPFIPDRGWDYYVALAGGFVPGRNARDQVIITDINGRRLRITDPITPETVITARTNHVLFFFNQYAPVVTTLLTLISTTITVVLLTR